MAILWGVVDTLACSGIAAVVVFGWCRYCVVSCCLVGLQLLCVFDLLVGWLVCGSVLTCWRVCVCSATLEGTRHVLWSVGMRLMSVVNGCCSEAPTPSSGGRQPGLPSQGRRGARGAWGAWGARRSRSATRMDVGHVNKNSVCHL